MSKKPAQVYSAEVVILKAAADSPTLEGPEIPEGCVVEVTGFWAIDLTTANKTIRLGYKRGGNTYWLKRMAAGTGAYGIHLDRPLLLAEHERPVAMIESVSADDELRLMVRGTYL